MRVLGSSFLLTISLVTTACAPHQLPPALVPEGELLPAWDYSTAAAVVRNPPASTCVEDPVRGSLLGLQLVAWRIIDRADGQRDEALWWAYFLTPDGPEWVLAMTFRDEDPRRPASWKFGRREPWSECGRPIYFRTRSAPTNRDLVSFFHTSGAAEVTRLSPGIDPGDWFHPTIQPGSRFVLRKAVVRSRAWELAFGSPPPPDFQP